MYPPFALGLTFCTDGISVRDDAFKSDGYDNACSFPYDVNTEEERALLFTYPMPVRIDSRLRAVFYTKFA
jgi:hypothetical protein